MNAGFVMVTGTAPGAGKTSLARRLTHALSARGVGVFHVDEDAVWGQRQTGRGPIDRSCVWPEFAELLTARPSIGFDDLLQTFWSVRRRRGPADVWIQDWLWPDLVALTREVRGGERELASFSAQLRLEAEPLRPVVVYLVGRPHTFLSRAVAERGEVWLERHVREVVGVGGRLTAIAEAYAERDDVRRRVLEAAGWRICCVRADDVGVAAVAERALVALEIEGT